jgi:hypothetical protein
MTDLHDLLRRASEVDAQPVPVTDDLARAHSALRRRRTWRAGAASLAVVAVVGAGVGLSSLVDGAGPDGTRIAAQPSSGPASVDVRDIELVASDLEVGPYVLGKIPDGWEVQAEDPVVIAPTDGSVTPDPNDFRGKLVVLYELNPIGPGDTVIWGDKSFKMRGDSGYRAIVRRTGGDEPAGIVVVQYPEDAWTQDLMLEFAAAVKVTDKATAGVG